MAHWGLQFAEGKSSGYLSNTTEAERIRDLQAFYGLSKWGFVVYRCTYGDDERWARLIARLNAHKDFVLQDHYKQPELAATYDWNVQEDPSLDGATKDEVRRRFRQWVAVNPRVEIPDDLEDFKKKAVMRENPRYNYCMHVDWDAMVSVTQPPPSAYVTEGPMTGYVNLIRADENWDLPDFDRFDWEGHMSSNGKDLDEEAGDEDGDEDEYDEGEPEIEGSRLHDVGWMMVSAESLLPETYETFVRGSAWDRLYCRPPKVLER